jgi:predicted ribosomally synthesized peptide with SipW-like signal peptide
MKKSILLSLMVIGAVAAMITAATSASFTDSVTSSSNSFSTKVVDLSLGAGPANCVEAGPSYGGPCTQTTVNTFVGGHGQSDLRPGDTVTFDYTVTNSGTASFTYTAALDGTTGALFTCGTGGTSVVPSLVGTPTTLAPSATQTITAKVVFTSGTGDNDCQGKAGSFAVKFVATQS